MAILSGGRFYAPGTDFSGMRRVGGRGPVQLAGVVVRGVDCDRCKRCLDEPLADVRWCARNIKACGDAAADCVIEAGKAAAALILATVGGGGAGAAASTGGGDPARTTPTIRREGVGNVFIERKDRGRYERGAPWGAYGTYWFMDWGDGRRFTTKELGEGGILFYKDHLILKHAGGCPKDAAFRGNVNCKSFLSISRKGIGDRPTAWILLDGENKNKVLTAPLISEGFPGNKLPAKSVTLRQSGPYPREGDSDETQLTSWAAEVEAAEDTTARTVAATQNLAKAATAGREAAWTIALSRTTDPRHLAILLGESTAADWEPLVVAASGGRSTQTQGDGGGGGGDEGGLVPPAFAWGKWVGIGTGVLVLGAIAFAFSRRRRLSPA